MKFTISTTTTNFICHAIDEMNTLSDNDAAPTSGVVLGAVQKINSLENFSAGFERTGDIEETYLHVEINDEVVIRFVKLYMKTARLVSPVIKAAVNMFESINVLIQGDCDDLVSFIKQRK